jgi:hypothetical protein
MIVLKAISLYQRVFKYNNTLQLAMQLPVAPGRKATLHALLMMPFFSNAASDSVLAAQVCHSQGAHACQPPRLLC